MGAARVRRPAGGKGEGYNFAMERSVDPAGFILRDVGVTRQGGDRLRAP